MCGIAGLMTLDGSVAPEGPLARMSAAMAHRGPDGNGQYREDDIGLVQTRLAIIDLKGGDQPILGPVLNGDNKTSAAIVANGEIYNYLELGKLMSGVSFKTRSDSEIPLHLYLRHGLDFVRHLRGMYAIAIHDVRKKRLVLTRDPFGIKPLYYAETPKGFAFASEPQALIKAGLCRAVVRPESRTELLQLQFSLGRETLFESIRRVLPGETLVVERGRITNRRRNEALPFMRPEKWKKSEALELLDKALTDSVLFHQRSDVPYGMFLSGGVDSSAVLALMRDLNDTPVQTFCAGFSGTDAFDEREHARTVARAADADFEAVDFGEDDFWSLLPEIASAMDDPAADYAILPTYKLAAKAKKRGLKVILSGEGGDELFAGYGRYRRAARWRFLGGRPMRSKGALDGLGVLRDDAGDWRQGVKAADAQANIQGRSRLQANQAADCANWLANDLLIKLDRCLMAHGVEGRTPFLDPKVAAVAFRLPDALKVNQGQGKWLLRHWLDKKLPAAKAFSKKSGFTVPVGHWIEKKGAEIGELVAAQSGIREACRPDKVRRLFAASGKKEAKAAWHLLFYALWHRIHIEGLDFYPDVFETLAVRND
jgi:asparagine synthase (glutamine-hydrolysing)